MNLQILNSLRHMKDFKMIHHGNGDLTIEAEGIVYYATYDSTEDMLLNAYIHILSHIQAKYLIKAHT